MSELFVSVMHISNFAEIVSNLNKVGEKVLEDYLAEFYIKLAGNIETANSIIVDLRASIDIDRINQQEVLQICEDAIYPYGKPEDNQITIHIGDCKEWALLLEKALTVLHLPIEKI